MNDDPLAHALNQVCDRILGNFVPPATTILAVRRFNGCMAILCKRVSLAVQDDGVVVSVEKGTQGPDIA